MSGHNDNLTLWFYRQQEQYAARTWLWGKVNGAWQAFRYGECGQQILALANSLVGFGLKPRMPVILLAANSPYWVLGNFAVIAAAAIPTPAYTSYCAEDLAHLAADSGAAFAIVDNIEFATALLEATAKDKHLRQVILIKPPSHDGLQSLQKRFGGVQFHLWQDLLTPPKLAYKDWHGLPGAKAKNSDTAAIIYTSGTSAQALGVELSHKSLLCNINGARAVISKLPFLNQSQERFLSFLPLSHAYEYMCAQFLSACIGAEVFFTTIENLRADIAITRPSLMTAVPRLYESLRTGIGKNIRKSHPITQILFAITVAQGQEKYQKASTLSCYRRTIMALSDVLFAHAIRRRLQKSLGGRLKAFISGGAPLDPQVALFFTALDILILQGYGLTETSPIVSVNLPAAYNHRKPDDIYGVGYPMQGVQLKIAADGEILIRGDLLMNGYWNKPEKTASHIRDGWLYSGDVGHIDAKGRLHISDRKKDIIVTSSGDNIAPQKLENKLTSHDSIAQALVYADKNSRIKALIVAEKASANEAIQNAIQEVNTQLDSFERIRGFTLISQAFTIESRLMTPSMKLRRRAILKKYADKL